MKTIILSIVMVLSFTVAKTQNFHFTLFAGVSNYQGDLQPKKFTFQQGNLALGAGGLYELSEKLYLRGNFTVGKISGDDRKSYQNASRNLNFSSQIIDMHLGLEYDLLNSYDRSLVPFIFAGVSVFHFSPYTFDTLGRKVFLQPLGTEGQGFFQGRTKYNLTQLALPFGGGLKLAVNENVRLRFEIGFRKTSTDYLDDVSTTYADKAQLLTNNGQRAVDLAFRGDEVKGSSATYPAVNTQRGNARSKDMYYFAGLGISFRISPMDGGHQRSGGSGGGGRGKIGCPTNLY
jgi:hypothetical protein